MKVALLTDGIYPYVLGGMQKHSFFLAKYLARQGVHIHLVHCVLHDQPLPEALTEFSAEEQPFIESTVLHFPAPGKLPGHYVRKSFQFSEQVFAAISDRLEEYDFIYAKGFCAWKLLQERKRGLATPPIGVKFHGMNMFQKPPSFRGWLEQFLFRGPVRFNMQQADAVFSYGGKITDITVAAGVPRDKIIELRTGIEQHKLATDPAPGAEKRRFLYVGRYERLKGVEEIGRAVLELAKDHDFEMHFVGPIPEHLQRRSPVVKYWGTIREWDELQPVFRSCDVLLCPSYSEGMPNAIIEAMALGLGVIATDVGAINQLVDQQNGWLLPTATVAGIRQAMAEAMTCAPAALAAKKQASLQRVREELLWEDIARQLRAHIEKFTG